MKKNEFNSMFTEPIVPIVIWMNPNPSLVQKAWESDLGIKVLKDAGGEIAAKYGVSENHRAMFVLNDKHIVQDLQMSSMAIESRPNDALYLIQKYA